ncbi:DUF2868 domain-containing protein [Aromatoleum bremense]|uniref:DUF2868 domain-containing protein n=1 Tax=Aromatoleum bremense TaxID=76115 RepID=UPI001BB69DEC|nr:DUF2868 domain-containing protein [Aromatoleum bremense]QTQ33177.1 putative protein DUf2868 [Aromatoleum bremense]
MPAPDSTRLTAFESRWLAEALRLREEAAGPLDDRDAVAAVRAIDGGVEERIVRRALLLGEHEGMAGMIAAWRARSRLVLMLASAVALASGFGAALAVLGDGTRAVNVVWTLGGLLGVHLLSLLLWALGLSLGGRDAGGALGRVWLWLSTRLSPAGPAAGYVAKALAGLLGRARLLRWWLGAVTHGLWFAALCGALLGLLATLSARRYGFAWETTILSADVFVHLVRIVGWLPAQVGFAVPDAEHVRASGVAAAVDEAARIAWSSWLLGCVTMYGIVPRALLWAVCLVLWRVGRARLRLDLALPGYAVLVARLAPASERIGVTDADPGHFAGPRADGTHPLGSGAPLAVGLELPAGAGWPSALPAGVRDAGVIDSREQRKRLVAELQADPPARLLVACDARQTPDRGSLELIAELSRHAGDCRVWLTGGDGAGGHAPHWRESLDGIGMEAERVIGTPADAMDWLRGAGTGAEND